MSDRRAILATVGPGLLVLVLLFAVPLALLMAYAFSATGPRDPAGFSFTLDNVRRALEPTYLAVLWRSIWLAAVTTVISAAIGFPVAWAVRAMPRRRQLLVLALLIIPAWLNLLVKNYAWIVILRREGVLNTLLLSLGVIDEPLQLLFNQWAVLLGLVHTYLPFFILPVYAALERLDWRTVEAARDLGAGPGQTLRRVVLPQSAAGIIVGSLLVFVPALGAFVTPDLLGGTDSLMIATLIENQILAARDWPFGAALAA
ncbi:MAG TPA: ABC transporter permease, partial [Longimicrobiales bacterium]|nr:ABC transporter permease [Longimicrobiales bacterium]